jgi:hypothetical protein
MKHKKGGKEIKMFATGIYIYITILTIKTNSLVKFRRLNTGKVKKGLTVFRHIRLACFSQLIYPIQV